MAKRATKSKKEKAPKEKKERKTRVKKDKNAPKRALSPYFFYMKTRRDVLKKEQPNLDHKQIISTLADEWNKLSESAKAPYVKKSEADKSRYEKEMKILCPKSFCRNRKIREKIC